MNSQIPKIAQTILDVLSKQEQMHVFGMQPDRQVGAEVMLFSNGRLVIEPTLSCDGEELNVGQDTIDLKEAEQFLVGGSTSFREKFDVSINERGKTKIMRITTKAAETAK